MNSSDWVFVLFVMVMLVLFGMFLIDVYFTRKEKFVERLQAKLEEKD